MMYDLSSIKHMFSGHIGQDILSKDFFNLDIEFSTSYERLKTTDTIAYVTETQG